MEDAIIFMTQKALSNLKTQGNTVAVMFLNSFPLQRLVMQLHPHTLNLNLGASCCREVPMICCATLVPYPSCKAPFGDHGQLAKPSPLAPHGDERLPLAVQDSFAFPLLTVEEGVFVETSLPSVET